jgi:hypothetical protein
MKIKVKGKQRDFGPIFEMTGGLWNRLKRVCKFWGFGSGETHTTSMAMMWGTLGKKGEQE